MRLARSLVWRCVSALSGLALLAPAAVASPLLTAAEPRTPTRALPLAPRHAILRPLPIFNDRIVALERVQMALSRVADGSTYVWHLADRLSGTVKPTSTFRNTGGDLCRYLIVELSAGDRLRTSEGVACRQPGGVWRLEG